jgi:hypothetical protein
VETGLRCKVGFKRAKISTWTLAAAEAESEVRVSHAQATSAGDMEHPSTTIKIQSQDVALMLTAADRSVVWKKKIYTSRRYNGRMMQ